MRLRVLATLAVSDSAPRTVRQPKRGRGDALEKSDNDRAPAIPPFGTRNAAVVGEEGDLLELSDVGFVADAIPYDRTVAGGVEHGAHAQHRLCLRRPEGARVRANIRSLGRQK